MLTDLKLTQTKKIIQFFYFIKKKKGRDDTRK